MTVYGYARVSSEDQNLDRQRETLTGVDKLITEKASGKNITDRPELTRLLDWVSAGDTIRVKSIDRLGRNSRELLNIVEDLKNKNVAVEFVDQPMFNVTSKEGYAMLTVFSAFAELERESIKERQLQGIALAKERGTYSKPRPKARKLSDEQIADAQERRTGGESVADIAADLGVSRQSIYSITHV